MTPQEFFDDVIMYNMMIPFDILDSKLNKAIDNNSSLVMFYFYHFLISAMTVIGLITIVASFLAYWIMFTVMAAALVFGFIILLIEYPVIVSIAVISIAIVFLTMLSSKETIRRRKENNESITML